MPQPPLALITNQSAVSPEAALERLEKLIRGRDPIVSARALRWTLRERQVRSAMQRSLPR